MSMIEKNGYFFHLTAEVSEKATIGEGTKIWHFAQVREEARIGMNCIIGKGAYIDHGVAIGDNVKIQNFVSIYNGATIEDGVFIGPHTCFTNDRKPRAINEAGELKSDDDWSITRTKVKKGASIGANATVLPGLTIGEFALIGAGSVVTKDIPPYTLVFGNPARERGRVNEGGEVIERH